MIKEISNFIESIQPKYFTEDISPSPGLHIKLLLNDNNEVIKESYKSYAYNKKGTPFEIDENGDEILIECNEDFSKLEYYSGFVTINKAVDFRRKLHSSSPFVLWFKKGVIELVEDRLHDYFKKVKEYVEESKIKLVENIEFFSKTNLLMLIKNDNKIKTIKENEYIKIYFDVPFELVLTAHNKYLKEKIYVKDDFNKVDDESEQVVGLSGFLNGANIKKKYMMHQTSRFKVNNRITQSEAINLFKFEKLLKSKPRKLPNPFPLFIEKEELNSEVVRLYSREGVNKFQNIIKQLFIDSKDDLTNYYLINWNNTKKGIVLNDMDYVSSFAYKLEQIIISNPMGLNDKVDLKISNVFQFELEIVQKIFNNSLIVKTKKGDVLLKYFDEIDSKYCSKTTYQNILSYRKVFYDFIYKSKREALNHTILYNILMSEIRDEIKRNEDFTKTYGVKEKLNILFSVNKYFDKKNKNFGGLDMPSVIPNYLQQLREVITNDGKHLTEDDNLFAFATGQLIYYILFQSQTTNKTHALLEPYISKNDFNQLKMTIARGIEQFKHSLNFGHKKFEKLASEVLGYNCEKEIKKLLPTILAGYFSNNLLLEKNN